MTVRLVVKAVRELYADLPAAEFSALKQKALRQGWVAAGPSRGEVDRRARIVKKIFRWAAGEGLVPAATHAGLAVVDGLQKGRTATVAPDAGTAHRPGRRPVRRRSSPSCGCAG